MSSEKEDVYDKILSSLVELNRWEGTNVPVLNSLIGRHVYFSIASELVADSAPSGVRSLKQVLNHPIYTDRAIRLKLREMERMGLIATNCEAGDKRVRNLLPSPELIELMQMHAKKTKKILENNFIILEK